MKTEKAVFAAGCFWGVEAEFMKVKGVMSTAVGYTGGHTARPTYEQVCSDRTGHAEAVLVEFDPKKISFGKLLKKFWEIHDPTTMNRQGPDIGTQYRSAIFYMSEAQKRTAEASRETEQKKFKGKIVTEITKSGSFYPAEKYHQKYLQKTCRAVC